MLSSSLIYDTQKYEGQGCTGISIKVGRRVRASANWKLKKGSERMTRIADYTGSARARTVIIAIPVGLPISICDAKPRPSLLSQ